MNINQIIINQTNNQILPFTYNGESAINADGTEIRFTIRTERTSYFNDTYLLNPSTPENSTIYFHVPEEENSIYRHDPIFYVDLIMNNQDGVNKVSARGEENIYGYNTPKYVFRMPKFTWNKTLITPTTITSISTPMADSIGSLWIGSELKTIAKIEYNTLKAQLSYSFASDSEVKYMTTNKGNNDYYFTTYDHIHKYLIDHYLNSSKIYSMTINKEISKYNDGTKIVYVDNDEIWSVDSYLGKIYSLDMTTLCPIQTIEGFDAPFKIIKSTYHDCLFIAGKNMVWKVKNNIKTVVYQINGYSIADIAVSKNGELCILFNGTNDSIVRIVDRNLYRILVDQRFTGTPRYCEYCNTGYFYAIIEGDRMENSISTTNFLYNIDNGHIDLISSTINIEDFEETTSETPATQKIDIEYPLGGEIFIHGQQIDLKWKSSESITDLVKIELYKSGVLFDTIINQATNTGIYPWTVKSNIPYDDDYSIKISWLTANVNPADTDTSGTFEIAETIPESSEEIVDVGQIAGIAFDSYNNHVAIVLKNGYMGFFDIDSLTLYGLFDTTIRNVNCMTLRNERVKLFANDISKVRIFVGTAPYLSDKWDSGEMSIDNLSIAYGKGNNLVHGETYYTNLQVCSDSMGWSEVQTQKWIMPN